MEGQFVALFIFMGVLVPHVAGCYDNYTTCYRTFTTVPVPDPRSDQVTTNYCNAVIEFDTCLVNDAESCEAGTIAPKVYDNYISDIKERKELCEMYCPGMLSCFKLYGVQNVLKLCLNVVNLLKCVKLKCIGEPQIGKHTLTKIGEVFTDMCTVIQKHPLLTRCISFIECLATAPSLPGTGNTEESYLEVRDSDKWCSKAKAYVKCGVTSSCDLSSAFYGDIEALETRVGATCSADRHISVNGFLMALLAVYFFIF